MKKNIIALIVLYNIKIHHWLKCSNKTLLNRSAVLSNFANKKWKTRYSCPHLSTILDKIKWNRKPPSPHEAARRAKTRDFPILDLGGGGGVSRFPIYFVQDCSWGPHSARVFAFWKSKWPPSEWFMNPSVLGFIFPCVIWSKRLRLVTKGKKVF